MNKIVNEIFYYFSRKMFFSQIIVLQLIVCFSVFLFSVSFAEYSGYQTKKYDEIYAEKHYYKLTDYFIGDEQKYLEKDDSLQKIKLFYDNLVEYEGFEYNEIYEQPIYLDDFNGEDKFFFGYAESGNTKRLDNMCLLNTVWCGYNILDNFALEIDEGRWFDKSEFENTYDEVIPVVLGNSYKKYYKLGDVISSETMTDDEFGNEKVRVTGFLKENSIVSSNQKFIKLDEYIVFPSYNIRKIAETEQEKRDMLVLYLIKTGGEISSKKNAEYVQSCVSEICRDLKIEPYYRVLGAENQQIEYIHTDIEACNHLLYLLSVVMLIFSCGMLTVFQIITIKQNIKYFSVLLISGMNYNDIFIIILSQGCIFQIEALFFSVCVNIISCNVLDIGFSMNGAVLMMIISFLITSVSAIISFFRFTGYDVAQNLRKR